MQKQLLDSIAIDRAECLDTEEAIREQIQELTVSIRLFPFGKFISFVNFSKFGELEISIFVNDSSSCPHFLS